MPAPPPPPARIARAVELLAPRPGERVLELGCGPGVAVDLIAAALGDADGGRIDAIDRSATAIERAEARNAAHVAAGRATFAQVALEAFAPPAHAYDAILAVNVNHFWTSDPAPALAALAGALRAPGGRLLLCWNAPGGAAQPSARIDGVAEALRAAGFEAVGIAAADPIVCVRGIR